MVPWTLMIVLSAPNAGTTGQTRRTQNPGTAQQQRNQSGEQPAGERGGERVPANRNTTGGSQGGQQGNEQPSMTGGTNNRTEQAPPAEDNRRGDTGTREPPANRRNSESAR
jgi:hypothetical protein